MARIAANTTGSILAIKEFLGLNQARDGDTHLKTGELSDMRNFRITRDRHLQIRPGQKTLVNLRTLWNALPASSKPSGFSGEPKFCGVWTGYVNNARKVLAAFGGVVFDVSIASGTASAVGTCTQSQTSFFGFGNKVYLLNGHEYKSWDGGASSQFQTVEGYIPTVVTACTPAGAGTQLEVVNRLTGKRRVKFSPDGTSTTFQLPERDIDEVVSVDGSSISYTVNKPNGTLTFSSAPTKGTNSLAVVYRKGDGGRDQVTGMRFAELYNGATDTRVFLYGDGSNKTVYSGVDLDKGVPSAEYFPDLYEASIGDSNTPITSMIRHYARLLAFKEGSVWTIDYNIVTTAGGAATTAFYVSPVNRMTGNSAPGQVQLMENNPLSIDGGHIYQWKATSNSGNITTDARNAIRISDRVQTALSGFDMAGLRTFNFRSENEFWFFDGSGHALILNYGCDAWYLYTNMPFASMFELEQQPYGCTADGKIVHISRQYRNDNGAEIDAYAETGSMDFDRDWQLKYSPLIYVAIQPETGARVYVSVETNRRGDYPDKIVSAGFSTFSHVDFRHWSFGTNHKPRVKRVKMKVKKATFYKLIFRMKSASAAATVLESDISLRYTGNVK